MESTAKATVNQPRASTEMKIMAITDATPSKQHIQCEHQKQKAFRLRGGGAAKDCFKGMIGCFLCCECCEGCCDCVADIICCPCEMCCGGDSN